MQSPIHFLIGLFVLNLGFSDIVHADRKRPDHFVGKPSRTLEEAFTNFSEYNARLAAFLAKGELTLQDVQQVHELTYTLENSLEKIRSEFTVLAETLEAIHVASENADIATVKTKAKIYLDGANKVWKVQ